MSSMTIFKNGSASTGRRTLSELAQSLAHTGTFRRIQTNTNGTFKRLVNGEQIGDAVRGEINVIIVAALPKVSRVFYKEQYDPNKEATAPNCWSNLGDKPEAGASDIQAENCTVCPQNIMGSGQNGGRACRFQRRIAVLVEGDTTGEVYQFNVPAKSLFGKGTGNVHPFEGYVKFLIANGESPDTVVTNISYDINADSMELLFTPVRNISDAEYDLVVQAQEDPQTKAYTQLTVAAADGVTKLPPQAAAVRLQAPEPPKAVVRSDEPEENEETPPKALRTEMFSQSSQQVVAEEDEVDEPTRRLRKKAEPTPPPPTANGLPDLSAILAQWGKGD